MIIQRLFSSKAQKARRAKWEIEVGKKAVKSQHPFAPMYGSNDYFNRSGQKKKVEDVTMKEMKKLGRQVLKSSSPESSYVSGIDLNKDKLAEKATDSGKLEYLNERKKKAKEMADRNKEIKKLEENMKKTLRKGNLKKGGKAALITGGAVAAGIGAKKLADKKKAKKEEKK